MTAADTALRVTRWAATDVRAPLPEGGLGDARALGAPGADLLAELGRLACVTAARLRLAPSPLGDERPPGVGAALLAAALGGSRHAEKARLLLRAVPRPRTARDLLAYHGLAGPAAGLLPGYADRLRDLSPLTGLLDRPGPRTVTDCEDLLDRLRGEPYGRALLVRRFAAPPAEPEQALWRGECLAYIRHEDPDFVLDVYETAFLYHRTEHEIRARAAWVHLDAGSPRTAVPTATWWRALAELEAADSARVRRRTQLADRRFGTNLFRRVRDLETA